MKNGSVVERNPVHLASSSRISPVFGATRETYEVGNSDRRLVRKKYAGQLAGCGVDNCGRGQDRGRAGFFWRRFLRRWCGSLRHEL